VSDTSLLYKDETGTWRWKRTSANGEVVGASTEGYVRRYDCVENYRRINGPDAPPLLMSHEDWDDGDA
jgi:uncharacterized protein YegP (UPF0339 family)